MMTRMTRIFSIIFGNHANLVKIVVQTKGGFAPIASDISPE